MELQNQIAEQSGEIEVLNQEVRQLREEVSFVCTVCFRLKGGGFNRNVDAIFPGVSTLQAGHAGEGEEQEPGAEIEPGARAREGGWRREMNSCGQNQAYKAEN